MSETDAATTDTTPALPRVTRPLTPPIRVIDDVLRYPERYREEALAHEFRDWPIGSHLFRNIARTDDLSLPTLLEDLLLPGAISTLTFFRKSPYGQAEPNLVHSDAEMGDWTAILYLNPDPPADDGTQFYLHKPSGLREGAWLEFETDGLDRSRWRMWRGVQAKFNRLLIFRASLFHARAIEENYGEGDEARLTQVVFGRIP